MNIETVYIKDYLRK